MSAATTCATVGTYVFGTSTISGLLWADSLSTWNGRLWVVGLVSAAFCVFSLILDRCRDRELAALKLGLEMARMTPPSEVRSGPRTRHLMAVGSPPSES